MLRGYRLRKTQGRFLESCRNLREGRRFWEAGGPLKRWLLQVVVPVPLLGLHADGRRLLEALEWLEANARARRLDLDALRRYHRTILPGEGAGAWRKTAVVVEGGSVPLPPPQRVPAMLQQLESRLLRDQEELDARPDRGRTLALAAGAYHRIGFIHPFTDGNGRVARLALNHLLRRYGLDYCILPPLGESPELFRALEDACHGRGEPLLDFVRRHVR